MSRNMKVFITHTQIWNKSSRFINNCVLILPSCHYRFRLESSFPLEPIFWLNTWLNKCALCNESSVLLQAYQVECTKLLFLRRARSMTVHLLAKSLMKNRHYSIHCTKLPMAFLSIEGCFLRMKEILIFSLNQKYFLLSIKTFYIVRLPLIQHFHP